MATSSSKRGQFWRADWFVGVLVVHSATDFGIARITDSSRTKTGLVLGTPSFMSPEPIAGKKVDGRSDLYSLGVMLFQMLAGVLPFRGDFMAELMYKIANEPAPDIRAIRHAASARLADVVALSLGKKPETRYQDGDQFAADLRVSIAELSAVSTGPAVPAGAITPSPEDRGKDSSVHGRRQSSVCTDNCSPLPAGSSGRH